MAAATPAGASASDFVEPWKNPERALVIDAYEYNPIDWPALVSDKRIVGFINKASDGLPPAYACSGGETEFRLCKALWKRHAVARELFLTRRTLAKALGLKWGAYHLARPGNPVEQADNFIDFAQPAPDDLLALDIEDNDPEKWMSLEDAEEFVRQVHRRAGRFPILYTNGMTARHIAEHRDRYRLLSRLPLWYARYKPEIDTHFPKGNWHGYALWQFSAQANCGKRLCPYRVPGTPDDIDVNVAPMTAAELRGRWPFGALIDVPADYLASVPLPIPREAALKGDFTVTYAAVAAPPTADELTAAVGAWWRRFADGFRLPPAHGTNPYRYGMAEYVASLRDGQSTVPASQGAEIDAVVTGSIAAGDRPR
ncbi:glycoside hydrolase family 25 protein [Aquamicrobium terrae]